MWYNPDSVSITPLISHYSKILGPALHNYNDWAARSMLLLRKGRRVSEIALMWPIHTLEAWFGFEPGRPSWIFHDVPPLLDYRVVSDMLTGELRRDFTYVHPEKICSDPYTIENGKLILNNKITKQEYSVIILPSLRVESYKTMQRLLSFYEQGGKIIATGILPVKSAEMGKDKELVSLVQQIFGINPEQLPGTTHKQTNTKNGMAVFLPVAQKNEMEVLLSEMIPSPDVKIEDIPGLYDGTINAPEQRNTTMGMFSYIHKEIDGRQIYYFTNSTKKAVDTKVSIRGKWKIYRCNPHIGSIESWNNVEYYKDNSGRNYTKFPLKLDMVSTMFAVGE
jgi:hypothetical protein